MSILILIAQLFWFFLPAAAANMSPVFVQRVWPRLGTPIDFGKTFRGKPIFGSHKTWRGLIAGTIGGGLLFLLQWYTQSVVEVVTLWPFDASKEAVVEFGYAGVLPIWFGFGMGFCALLGDAIKSFFKRRVSVQPGKPWFPFDQIDFILGAALFSAIFIDFTPLMWVLMLTVGPVLHILINRIGFALKLKDVPW